MNWLYVILAVYILAALFIVLVLLRKKRWPWVPVVLAAAFVLWTSLDVPRFLPPGSGGDVQSEQAAFDVEVAHLPVLQVIREQEPALFNQLRKQALGLEQAGRSSEQIMAALQPQITALQVKRLQSAPDASVIRYMQPNMQQTVLMQKESDDACFRFLFPAVRGGVNAAEVLPAQVTEHRMQVDAEMMRAALGPDSHTMTDEERARAQKDFLPVLQALVNEYGRDVELISKPQQAQTLQQEGKVCQIVQSLWRRVLALPAPKAASIIRLSVALEEENTPRRDVAP